MHSWLQPHAPAVSPAGIVHSQLATPVPALGGKWWAPGMHLRLWLHELLTAQLSILQPSHLSRKWWASGASDPRCLVAIFM